MAKSASPIRLQAELMQVAESTAKRYHRSTAEQIEYWADLGRSISSSVDPDILLSIASGLTVIKTEAVFSSAIDPNDVFSTLERNRQSGVLQESVSSNSVQYQASTKYLGYLEQSDQDGQIITGQFEDGEFIAKKETILEKG